MTRSFDAVIYGATMAGIVAAKRLAKAGHTSVILEWTSHVGGMITGGFGLTDRSLAAVWKWGLTHDFFKLIGAQYGLAGPQWSFAASEARIALTRFLHADPRITILTGQRLLRVAKDPATQQITEVMTATDNFAGKVFLDCSYEGDLAHTSGVTMISGREGEATDGETWGGQGDAGTQACNFRLMLSKALHRRPWPKPPGYRREDFLPYLPALRRRPIATAECRTHLVGADRDRYVTTGGDVIGLSNPWQDYDGRERIKAQIYYRTAGRLYFQANDPAVPPGDRIFARSLGLCADEFQDDWYGAPGWPPALHVRDARRIVGRHVMTTSDMALAATAQTKPDPIALGGCHGDDEGGIGRIFQIPLRSVLPQAGQVTNLIVPVAASVSRAGFMSYRMEPTWMLVAQSCGVLAAIAIASGRPAGLVPYADLRPRLDADGAILSW
ncbi:MAG TPA: FAD-dependent oxidoreductase [Inquilinus sp.]|nr:FAD-dependent oxidoreductase [Inquilinus sp.]